MSPCIASLHPPHKPYWGLRSYLPLGHPLKHLEIGSEPTLQAHIAKLVEVFAEVRRVLHKDGTLWLNYGDMWANDGKWGGATGGKQAYLPDETRERNGRQKRKTGFKPKDLCMAPHRLAIALQDAGWWVRSDIVWHKPNPMPSSVTDRPTPSKEFVFLLSKSAKYFYDAEAIAEPRAGNKRVKVPGGWDTGTGAHGTINRSGRTSAQYVPINRACVLEERARPPGTAPQSGLNKNEASPVRRRAGFNGRWDETEEAGADPLTRNARDVWTIATQPFPEAHYATFPAALAERCIKAGCPLGGTVLDPFGGSGTVGLVADRLQRSAILIDLDPANSPMSERRIMRDAPLFATVETAA